MNDKRVEVVRGVINEEIREEEESNIVTQYLKHSPAIVSERIVAALEPYMLSEEEREAIHKLAMGFSVIVRPNTEAEKIIISLAARLTPPPEPVCGKHGYPMNDEDVIEKTTLQKKRK